MSDLLIDVQEILTMRLDFSSQVKELVKRNNISEGYARIVIEDELIRQSRSLRSRLQQLKNTN